MTEKYAADEGVRQKPTRPNIEEIGNLPEKEFRVMIVEMTQHRKNKMEVKNKNKIK